MSDPFAPVASAPMTRASGTPCSTDPACLEQVIRIVGAFVAELHHPRAAAAVSGDSHLERDFSMHSVERLELVLRLEEAFGIQVPDHAASNAEYVGDLARLVSGRPAEGRSGRKLSPANTGEDHVEPAPGSLAFTVYAALLVLCVGSVVWLLLLVLPGERLPGRVLRRASRALLRASGCRLDVQGLEHLEHPALLVANHQSYLDSVVLMAALPAELKIVVNERLPRWPLVGTAIRRARHLVVDRTARDPRLACAAMAGALRAGESLLVFPEGTFADRAQLLPFRLGGFSAAVEARRPVVPVAIRGSRHILHASRWLLAKGPLSVTIHPAIRPRGPGWEETLRLRDEARACIAQSVSTGRDDPG